MPLMAHGWTQLLSNRTGSRHVGRSPLRQCPLHCSSGRRQSWKIWQRATSSRRAPERLTEQKFKAGQATGFDIERTRSEVIALRVEQEQLRRVRGEATHALDVLVGRIPGRLAAVLRLPLSPCPIGLPEACQANCCSSARRQSRAGASCSGDGAMERSRRRAVPQTCARFEWWAPTLREQRNTCGREHFLSGLGCDASDL